MGLGTALTVISLIPSIIKTVATLVETAEALFGSGTGTFKKELVKDGAKSFAGAMASVSTGGQKDTWNEVNDNWDVFDGAIDTVIDFFADTFFPNNEGPE